MATHPITSPLSTTQPIAIPEVPDRRFDHPAAIVCGLLFLTALALGVLHQVPGFGVETDFVGGFGPAARDLLHGRPYLYPYHPPGYAALLAVSSLVTGDLFVAGKLVGALSATLVAWFGYLLLRDLYSSRVAFAATILLAVGVMPYAYIASSDIPDAAAIIAAFLILFRPGRFTTGRAAALGAVAALSYLIRSSGIVVLIGALAVLLLLDPERRPVGARVRSALIVAALFLVTISPVYIYNVATLGRVFAPTAYAQIGPDLDPTVDRSTLSGTSAVIGSEAVTETLLSHPLAALNRYSRNVLYYYPPKLADGLLGFPLLLFAGAGLLVIVARPGRRRIGFVAVNLLAYAIIGVMVLQVRYLVLLLPLAFLLAALGMFPQTDHARRPWPLWLSWAALGLAAVWSGANRAVEIRDDLAEDPVYLRPAAAALDRLAQPGERVVSAKPHLAYLAGERGARPHGANLAEVLAHARAQGFHWIAYTAYEGERYPAVAPLGGDSLPAGLELVYEDRINHVRLFHIAP